MSVEFLMSSRFTALREIPLVRSVLKDRFERRFPTAQGISCLSGSYPSFDVARRATPAGVAIGYDHDEAGTLYKDRMQHVLLKDYPALLWLSRLMPDTRRLFDIGGHVGLMYYAYKPYLPYRPDLTWTVCDVPAVVRNGEALARERGAAALRFTTELTDADGTDVILATGSLQYIEQRLDALIASLATRPAHILVNETPTLPDREIITLQNIGLSICPYRIADHRALPSALAALGYEMVDSWEDPARRTEIPFVTAPNAVSYSGYYFRRT